MKNMLKPLGTGLLVAGLSMSALQLSAQRDHDGSEIRERMERQREQRESRELREKVTPERPETAESTKEQNDASQKLCEKAIEGLAGVAGAALCSRGGAGVARTCGVAFGIAATPAAERLCRNAREAHEKMSSGKPSSSAAKAAPEIEHARMNVTRTNGANNCTATRVVYTSKPRR